MLCHHLGRAVLGQARAVARPGQARLAVEGRAPRVVYQLVLLVLLVVVLQDVEDLGSWAVIVNWQHSCTGGRSPSRA